MFSQPLLKKWKDLMENKYSIKNPAQEEIFQFANTLTLFFDSLIKFDHENRSKQTAQNKENQKVILKNERQ